MIKIQKISKRNREKLLYKRENIIAKNCKDLKVGESIKITNYKQKTPLPILINGMQEKKGPLSGKRFQRRSFIDTEKKEEGWIVTRIK